MFPRPERVTSILLESGKGNNDLLDLSKFQAGRMTCDLEKNDLYAVVESVLNELSGIGKKKDVHVRVRGRFSETTCSVGWS